MLLLYAIDIASITATSSGMRKGIPHAPAHRSDCLQALGPERALGTAHREPLRERLRNRRAVLECGPRRTERPRPRGRAGVPDPGPQAGRARRRGLGGAPRAVLRQLGWGWRGALHWLRRGLADRRVHVGRAGA